MTSTSDTWPGALPRPGNRKLEQCESISPWFTVYFVSEDTFALLEPHHDEEVISYLVLGSERGVLIDSYPGLDDFAIAVGRWKPRAVARFVQVDGLYDTNG